MDENELLIVTAEVLLNKNVNVRYLRYCMSKRRGLKYYNATRPELEKLTYDEWELIRTAVNLGKNVWENLKSFETNCKQIED